ncbi:nucleotidyltransferase family protein [Paenibacillus sp. P96]|uniref:Nucleotidyltransferase family protein n=1 Tax=Paenibacillus zeirhizosphaerae TaxID=2987519 RepID=A0ABT9FVN2_9BACL|nr:nucleotidyltransferase family protein [Paenibacillus sp. P96]MDP4098724.1 nucleotidyltransferase family protein [Paenibacillus sp. P96]
MNAAGIVLAAGRSVRMGRDKLALPLQDGTSLASRVLQAAAASRLDPILVIGRSELPPSWLQMASGGSGAAERIRYIACPHADKGMAYSLKCGIQAVAALQSDAAVILLADQPLVASQHINALLEHFEANQQVDYVAASDQGTAKPPVLLASGFFSKLRSLEGDQGAGALINRPSSAGIGVPLPSHIFLDADTPEDLNLIMKKEAEGI